MLTCMCNRFNLAGTRNAMTLSLATEYICRLDGLQRARQTTTDWECGHTSCRPALRSILDEKKQWNVATNAYYNIQSHIKGTNRKAGNVLSLEGGVGRTFCKGLCTVGVDYYTQWKITNDKFPNVPPGFVSKHRYYGIGPEINGVLPINAKTMAIFKLAYFQEVGNRVATQGSSVIMSVTLGKLNP